jgi:ketosteroid isomerase-like protein
VRNADVVRSAFRAYLDGDQAQAQSLYSHDLVFSSPQDDHIGRDVFFDRCFPTATRFSYFQLLQVVELGSSDVLVLYEYELASGERFRNTEIISVHDGKIVEVQVFFGGRV